MVLVVEVGRALTTTFGRYEVAACGFWCQGPVLLQMLNLLEGVDVAALGHNTPAYLHRLVETVKLAFADRDAYYGDPHLVAVPAERLLSKAYARARRDLVGDRAWRDMPPAGEMPRAGARPAPVPLAGGSNDALDTSYVAVVDADGNGFSATPSDPNVDSPVVDGVGNPPEVLRLAVHTVAGLVRARVVPRGFRIRWCRIGRRNAAVFPLPVMAVARTSRPSRSGGMAARWMGVGAEKPMRSAAWTRPWWSPSSANDIGNTCAFRGHRTPAEGPL